MATKSRKKAVRTPARGQLETETVDEVEEDEQEIFRHRAQWLRSLYGEDVGISTHHVRMEAIAWAQRMEHAKIFAPDLDPGGGSPERGFEVVGDLKSKPRLSRTKNPRPKSSFGFAAEPVEVSSDIDINGAALKITLDKKLMTTLDQRGVRMFRFEEEIKEWVLIPRSGASADGEYAWAILHRPGVYVPIAVTTDPWLMFGIAALRVFYPILKAARSQDALEKALNALCDLIMLPGVIDKGEPELLDKFGMPPFSEGRGPKEIRRLITSLDLPNPGGMAEWDILDGICPPWFGQPWGKLPVDLPIVFPPFGFGGLYSAGGWTLLGPNNVSGRIKCLAIHPRRHDTLYAGAANGGVWKTTSGGRTWIALWQNELSMAIGGLAISESHPRILYAATGEDAPGFGATYGGVGVYRSMDEGRTWTLQAMVPLQRSTRALVDPNDPDIVYVCGEGGMYKSTNGGLNWVTLRTDHISDALLDPTDPEVVYAAVWNVGIFKSTRGGAFGTWRQLRGGLPDDVEWIKLAMGRNGPNGTRLLIAKLGRNSGSLFRSTNGGENWVGILGTFEPATYNEWTNMVAIDPNDENVIFAGGVGLQRSANGRNFTRIPGTHADHHQLVFSAADSNVCYIATDGGVYRSEDNGRHWVLTSQNLVATQLYSIGVSQRFGFLTGSATQDQGIIRRESDTRGDWIDTNAGNEGGFFVIDPNSRNNVYCTPWDGNLRRSTDGARSWTTILDGIGVIDRAWTVTGPSSFTDVTTELNNDTGADVTVPGAVGDALYIGASYKFSLFNYRATFAGVGGSMAVEYWNGSAWAAVSINARLSTPGATNLTAPSGSSFIFEVPDNWSASTVNGSYQFWLRLRVTRQYRVNPILERGLISAAGVQHLAVKPGDSNVLICVVRSRIYRSTNRGDRWEVVMEMAAAGQRVVFSSEPGVCFVSTEVGTIYRSNSNGESGSWVEPYDPSDAPRFGNIIAIAVSPVSSQRVAIGYAGMGRRDRVNISDDGGRTWANASGPPTDEGLPDSPVTCLVFDHRSVDTLYASTDIGVFRSRTGGSTWEPFNEGMPRIPVTELAMQTASNTLYASSFGRGAYKRIV